jgi:hypothetical protein
MDGFSFIVQACSILVVVYDRDARITKDLNLSNQVCDKSKKEHFLSSSKLGTATDWGG